MTEPRDPEELTALADDTVVAIAADTRLGPVALTVADLDRSIDYYESAIGLAVLDRSNGHVVLGAGSTELVRLEHVDGARPSHGRTGLYHFALLVPERRDLARWLAHAARDNVGLTGASDHFVSEAIYLRDPDHHGIEIYWDRPREIWEGQVASRLTTLPLDVDGLLGELDDRPSEPFDGLPSGTVMGHFHFKVAEIPDTVAFYREVLGFGVMAQLGGSAAFFSAGGYHHHVGANVWESAGAPPPGDGEAALRHAVVVLPSAQERDAVVGRVTSGGHEADEQDGGVLVRDPSGNGLLLTV